MLIKAVLLTLVISSCFCDVRAQQWKVYFDSAEQYRTERAYNEALRAYQQSQNLINKDSLQSDSYVAVIKGVADMYSYLGKPDSAIAAYLQVMPLVEKLHTKVYPVYAALLNNIGGAYANTNHIDKALSYLIEAKDIRRILFPHPSILYAESCAALANVYLSNGNYDIAASLYLEAKSIFDQLGQTRSKAYAACCNGLINYYIDIGDYEKAEPIALSTLDNRGKLWGLRDPHYALSCITLAELYTRMGQYEKAEPLLVQAKDIREDTFTRHHLLYVASCMDLADLYHQKGNYQKSERLYAEAIQLLSDMNPIDSSAYAKAYNSLANLDIETGDYIKAEKEALIADRIWSKLPNDDPTQAIDASTLGGVYFGLCQYKKSETYYLKAGELWKTQLGTLHPYYSNNTKFLAEVYWNLHNYNKAEFLYENALSAKIIQVNKVFLFTNENEKQAFVNSTTGAEDEYYSFLWEQPDSVGASEAYDISLSNRNIILSASRQIRQIVQQSKDSSLTNKYDQWINAKQRLAYLYTNDKDEDSSLLKRSEAEANQLEKILTIDADASRLFYHKSTHWRSIQQRLKGDEAAIEFVAFHYFNGKQWTDTTLYSALIIRKDVPYPIMVPLFAESMLDSMLQLNGSGENQNISVLYNRGIGMPQLRQNTSKLFSVIWGPLEKKLTGINTIYYAPSGLLNRISFAAIPIDKNRVLSDKYHLVQVSSTAVLIESHMDYINPKDKLYLYGGVQYQADSATLMEATAVYTADRGTGSSTPLFTGNRGETWNALPGTVTEIDSIRKNAEDYGLSVKTFKGLYASEESIKSLNTKSYPSILHIASHGFYYPDPGEDSAGFFTQLPVQGRVFKESKNPLLRSGIVLAGGNNTWNGHSIGGLDDGILTSYEVSNLYLPQINLVVLSACETALGDIQGSEGVYGLARAFKLAGVQHLVMSLWKVPDIETSEFMGLFYRHLFDKQSIQDAFYFTQQTMKEKYRSDPYKWAAWILII